MAYKLRDFSHNRSDAYQPILVEIPFSPDMMMEFYKDREAEMFNFEELKEERADLFEEMRERFWELVEQLTERQKQVLKLYYKERWTQTEIAKALGVNQSSITKSIHGNCDYKKEKGTIAPGANKKFSKNGRIIYGGAIKKLQKLMDADERIQDILRRIYEIEQDIKAV